jgi:hypothetical protein
MTTTCTDSTSSRLLTRVRVNVAAALAGMLLASCGGGGGSSDTDPTTPTLTAAGATRAVVRKNDTTPLPAAFAVTGTNMGNGTISWKDEGGTTRGTGASLTLSTAATALSTGEHTLTASVTNPNNGRSAQASFSLLVLADGAESDDDNDGLTYSQEKAAGTEPGNGDTDGDSLADGAEAGLGTNPTDADSDNDGINDGLDLAGNTTLPLRSVLAAEAGKSAGVQIGADGLSVAFGSELNAACVAGTAPFDNAIYAGSAFGREERCRKRAVRANVGVTPGEFRYFETRRFGGLNDADLQNIGQGIITPSAQIDPYCCYIDPGDADYTTYVTGSPPAATAANITPPSMTINSIGGVFTRLIRVDDPGFDTLLNLAQTTYYGFAVDYRGTDPLVYVVARDASGTMIVSDALNPGAFNNAAAMPMMHGHPVAGTGPHAAINLGLQNFHYSLAAVRAAIDAKGGDGAAMAGGVGIHRW